MRRMLLGISLAAGVAAAAVAAERFDYQARGNMFRAFRGDEAAFKSAMATIDTRLAEKPDDAEALAWRGVGRYWQAGQAFRAGNVAGAHDLSSAAMADIDRALALQPTRIGVLVPRAGVLLAAARSERDPAKARDLAARAAAAYETAFALRQDSFAQLDAHNRGEYLSGLAESWAIAGDRDKSEGYLRRILAELPGTPYAQQATAKLADWNDRRPLNCQTCHR
jgi:tetratricopeptide (TPR) repeat protein